MSGTRSGNRLAQIAEIRQGGVFNIEDCLRFGMLPEAGKTVVLDMSDPFKKFAKQNFPNALLGLFSVRGGTLGPQLVVKN